MDKKINQGEWECENHNKTRSCNNHRTGEVCSLRCKGEYKVSML